MSEVTVDLNVSKAFLLREYKRIASVNNFTTNTCQCVLDSVCKQHNLEVQYVLSEKVLPSLKSYLKKLISKHDKTKRKGGNQYQKLLSAWENEHYNMKVHVSERCLPEMHRLLKKERKCKKELIQKVKRGIQKSKRLRSQNMFLKRKFQKLYSKFLGKEAQGVVRPLRVTNSSLLSVSQQYKRKKMIMRDCKESLQFLGKYEMEAESLNMRNSDGDQISLNFKKEKILSEQKENFPSINLDNLIHLKDSENISNRTYHELAMIVPSLPRSHTVNKRVRELNENVSVLNTPNNTLGVQQSLKERLTSVVSKIIESRSSVSILSTNNVNVKLTGDGTEFGKRKKLVNFGFTVLDEDRCTSVKGNYLLAVFSAKESYDNIKKALEDIIMEARSLQYLVIDNMNINVTFFLGGDLKFLNMISGIASCACTYSCLWCKCSSPERYDITKQWSATSIEQGARTSEEITLMANRRTQKYNCIHPPIFDFIPLERVVPDLLHLYLRLSDQLVKHLISELRKRDNIEKCTQKYDRTKCKSVSCFEVFVQSLGIDFHFHNDKETGRFLFRDFTGPEHKHVAEKIKLHELIPGHPKLDQMVFLWTELGSICSALGRNSFEDAERITVGARCKTWVQVFAQVYQSKDVTPYMHILAYHVEEMIKLHGNLKRFSQQGFEKVNDNAKSWFFRSTSHRGREALKQIILKQN